MTPTKTSSRPRRCADCDQPIDDLPKHFKFCRLCFSKRPESRQPEDNGLRDDDLEGRDLERLLTGID